MVSNQVRPCKSCEATAVIDHRRRQNMIRTSVTHSAIASCATFLLLPHFDVICDLLLNRRTATWNLFVKSVATALELGKYPPLFTSTSVNDAGVI